jgi:ATP-dependent RNA helicase DeaD
MNQLEEFKALGLSDDILTAIAKKGFETPSAIQSLTIPHLLTTDKDIIAQAQTGTGKTAAFGLPIIQMLTSRRNIPQAIVLVPTRELALQVTQELISFNTHDLSIAPIYGGASMTEQLRRLKKGIDIVVGTPGRILDHIRRGTLDLSAIAYLVLDEADEMLNMGFIEDIEEIMHAMTGPKRVLLFSATMPDRIAALARNYMHEPDLLKVESQHVTTDLTNQIYFEVREGDKFDALTRIIDVEPEFYGIVFSRTRTGADDIVAKLLERGYAAEVLHGDISQAQREKILRKFRDKAVNILVATDVAARGIDVSNLSHVINYSLPQDSESYVHRIGRTGRAGNQGTAITFISGAELRRFNWMMRDIKADIKRETLPSPQDIVAMKRAKIKDDLQEIVANESYGDYADIAAELLESYAPDVALGALLRLAFRSELDQSNYPEIRSFSVDRKGKARLFLALGGRDGYTARRIVEMLKRKCGLRDKNIDDVRVFENYSLVSVPFSDAEAVVGQLNASGGRRRIAKIDGSDAENGGGKRRRPATEGRNGGEGASGSESAGEPRSETRGRRKAGQPEGAEEFRSERRPRRETAETADDAGERRPVTRSRKKAENNWNASPAGGNDGFDWEAFQRYDDAAAWEKPKRGGGTRSVRRSGRPVTTGRQAAPKRIAAKGRKR